MPDDPPVGLYPRRGRPGVPGRGGQAGAVGAAGPRLAGGHHAGPARRAGGGGGLAGQRQPSHPPPRPRLAGRTRGPGSRTQLFQACTEQGFSEQM